MHDSFDRPDEPGLPKEKEYQDSNFHDDDEVVPADDAEPHRQRPPTRRKPTRRPPMRRHYNED